MIKLDLKIFKSKFSFFIAKSLVVNQNKKVDMLYLSKEASTKNQHLKTQMMMTLNDDDSKKTENVWKENGFSRKKEQI